MQQNIPRFFRFSLLLWLSLLAILLCRLPEPKASVQSVSFAPKTDYSTGSGTHSVAVGDFNGDGKPDLVTANSNDDTISILPGTGTGTFGPATDFNAGDGAFSVAVGDFNNDGKLDLAT